MVLQFCIFRDNVEWSDEQKDEAVELIASKSEVKFTAEEIEKLETLQAENWDSFYSVHQNKFFKDRHWLFTEFPELAPKAEAPERVYPESDDIVVNKSTEVEQGMSTGRRIFELGSGVGNSECGIVFTLKIFWCSFYTFSGFSNPQIQQPQRRPDGVCLRFLPPSHRDSQDQSRVRREAMQGVRTRCDCWWVDCSLRRKFDRHVGFNLFRTPGHFKKVLTVFSF